MMGRLGLAALAAAIVVSGCAKEHVWYKPDFDQATFSKDRYDCLQQTRRPVASAYVGPYGGSAQQTIAVDDQLFGACMMARGYSFMQKKS